MVLTNDLLTMRGNFHETIYKLISSYNIWNEEYEEMVIRMEAFENSRLLLRARSFTELAQMFKKNFD